MANNGDRPTIRARTTSLCMSMSVGTCVSMILCCVFVQIVRMSILQVFAKENPSYRVLVYAAGAMDTKLTRDIRKVVGKDSAHIK